MSSLAVQMQGITKSFNRVRVLENVDFELRQGEIHALLGENGAGKSTLMKILRGIYSPSGGEIKVYGKPVQSHTSSEATANGIAMVFQEFSLIPSLTVAQNIFLTREPRTQLGLLNDRVCERQVSALFKTLDVDIDPRVRVAQLSTGYQQLTEIATALSQDAHVLILDEPTASLTQTETASLFKLIRRLKERGISIIYISHRMEEIFQIADRITVLRDGRHVITDDVDNLTIQKVIEYIIGRKGKGVLEWQERPIDREQEPLLEVKNLNSGLVQDVNFRLHGGEVLGLAGLMGSGRTELVQTLFGINPIESGEVRVNGRPLTIRGPDDSMKAGIALIPESRRDQGLILSHSLKENFLLPLLNLGRLTQRNGLVNDRKAAKLAANFIQKLDIRANSILEPIRLLSGGNQQKVVIAKWLSTDPDILLMDEPMAGVDIGTKAEIIQIVRQLAEMGKGIVIISSELQELLAVSDRILILRDGHIGQKLNRREIQTEEQLHQIVQGTQRND